MQVPVLSTRRFKEKIVEILSGDVIDTLKRIAIRKKARELDFLDLVYRGISDEQITILEYLLLADDFGRVNEKILREDTRIRLTEVVRRRIANLGKSLPPGIDPNKYRDYLITRVSKVLDVQIYRDYPPKESLIDIKDLITQAKIDLCDSEEAKRKCAIVRKSGGLEQHRDDVELAIAVTTYSVKKESLIVVPKLPSNYECFHHIIKYIARQRNLGDRLIILQS